MYYYNVLFSSLDLYLYAHDEKANILDRGVMNGESVLISPHSLSCTFNTFNSPG